MILKTIDVHAHLQFPQFDSDREALIAQMKERAMAVINVGTNLETSRQAVLLAAAHENCFAAVGLNPTEAGDPGGFAQGIFAALVKEPKVVAIGECGLDFYRGREDESAQRALFEEQIALANKSDKPLILHLRNAYREAIEVLGAARVSGAAHFFSGSWEEAKLFLDRDFYLSFAGPITFVRDYDEVVRRAPLERLLAETDAPFAPPAPYRGRRNQPFYVEEVVRRIAFLKGVSEQEARAALLQNAASLFRLKLAPTD